MRLILLLALALSGALQAAAPVWKVSQGDRVLYIGGTVHLLSEDDYPLPQAFEDAYQAAQHLVLETDIERAQSPEFAARLLQQMLYPRGESLLAKLSPPTRQALRDYLNSRGMPEARVRSFRPGLLLISATHIELQRLGVSGELGVDLYYATKAAEDGKPIKQLESLEQQLHFLGELGVGDEDAFIRYALADLQNMAAGWPAVLSAWRQGDIEELARITLDPSAKQFAQTWEQVLYQRNADWIPKIRALLDTPEVELILVGALHLHGERGVLAALQQNGYRVEQMP